MSNLTPKQQKFLEAYLGEANFNATEAARLAGYTGTHGSLRVTGHRLLRNANVSAEMNAAWEQRGMEPAEIIGRLSDLARASLEDFLDIEYGEDEDEDEQEFLEELDEEEERPKRKKRSTYRLDLGKAKKAGKLHCLKSLKETPFGFSITLHSPLDALDKMAKIRRLLNDVQIEIDVNILNVILEALPIEQREQFSRAIEAAVSPGSLTPDRR